MNLQSTDRTGNETMFASSAGLPIHLKSMSRKWILLLPLKLQNIHRNGKVSEYFPLPLLIKRRVICLICQETGSLHFSCWAEGSNNSAGWTHVHGISVDGCHHSPRWKWCSLLAIIDSYWFPIFTRHARIPRDPSICRPPSVLRWRNKSGDIIGAV